MILKNLLVLLKSVKLLIITYMPGEIGFKIRYNYYKRILNKIGTGVRIDIGVHIQNPQHVTIGNDVWIDKYAILLAGIPYKGERKFITKDNKDYCGDIGNLFIGNYCHIGAYTLISGMGGTYIGNGVGIASGCKIYSLSHHYRNLLDTSDKTIYKLTSMAPHSEQALISAPVVIKDNCAVGLNSVILPGVTMGENSWLGVSSVLSKNLPANVIASGNPAKIIKQRFTS